MRSKRDFDSVSFDEAFGNVVARNQAAGRGQISPVLKPLLRQLYDAIEAEVVSAAVVKEAALTILRYLTTTEGRTNANCWAVDMFMGEDWGAFDWELVLNPELADALRDMNGALHDTVQHPDIARNFDSTPEQLLQRIEVITV